MPSEIEAKLAVESHDAVRERLRALGAFCKGAATETDSIFDRPDGSLRSAGYGLRVRSRQCDDGRVTALLTVKGPVRTAPFKSREEREVGVEDAEQAAGMLRLLGYESVLCYEKRRERWRLADCHIELDEVARLGRFVEIEGPSVDAIRSVQQSLGLGAIDHTPASYVGMLLAYCAAHGLDANEIRL